jgi:zinc protease
MGTGKRFIVAIAVAAAAATAACGGYLRPPKPDQKALFTAQVAKFTSSNGFRFIVLPDANADVVRLDVRYHTGAMYDPPGKEGLAHLVEHMMFQTRIKTSSGELTVSQIHTGIAQWTNAYTDLDSTHYMAQVAREHLETAFTLEVARLRLGCSTWDEATFVREREVVRNEIRGRHVEAWGDVPRLLHEAAYPSGHPYRRETGGTDASISSITLADACAFMRRHYVPGNLTIVAAGRTTEAEIKALAAKMLGAFPPTTMNDPPRVARAPRSDGGTITHELDIDEPVLIALFALPPAGTLDGRLAEMATGGISERIGFFAVRHKWGHRPAVYTIGGARAPLLAVAVQMHDARDAGHARSAIETAMRQAVNDTRFIDNERWRTPIWLWYKERLIGQYESFASRPQLFADYEQFDDRDLFIVGRLKELDAVASDDIHRIGKEFLDPERGTYVLLKPRPGARRSGSGSFAYRASAHDPSSWRFPVDVAEADVPLALPKNRAPRLRVVEERLDNGLRLLMWPHSDIPITYGRLVVAAGAADEPEGKRGIAQVAGGAVSFDATTTSARDLSVDMDLTVERLSYFVRHGAAQNLDNWRELVGRSLKLPHEARRAEFNLAFQTALYGAGHPYAGGTLTPSSLRAIDGDSVASFQRTYHTAGNTTLVLTGKFDPGLAKRHARFNFGHLASKTRGPRQIPPAPGRSRREVITGLADAESPVVYVAIAFTAAPGIDRSYAARLILERVISARLTALREGLAVTYGMGASYAARIGPGEWRISGQLDAARAVEGMQTLQAVLDELRDDPAAWKGDFVINRRKLVDELLVSVTSPSRVAMQLSFIAELDLPLDHYDRLAEDLARVTPADLQAIIEAELAPGTEVIGIFGPPAAVDALKAAL